jgi:signal transduction histidine kinase
MGAPVLLPSLAAAQERFPEWAQIVAPEHRAWAAIPLMIGERILGALSLSFAEPQAFDEPSQSFLLALTRQGAQALDRAQLYDEAQSLNRDLETRVAERTAELQAANVQLEQSRQQLRRLADYLNRVREEERARAAREIQDEVGGLLAALKIDLAWLQEHREDLKPRALRHKMKSLFALIGTSIDTIRKISTALWPRILDEIGLVAAVEWQLSEFQTRTGIRCRLTKNVEESLLDRESATAAFRVFQEILADLARQGSATEVEVLLEETDGDFVLQVRDNGEVRTPEDLTTSEWLERHWIQERVLWRSGEIRINGVVGQGTTVTLRFPLGSTGEEGHD